MKPFTKYVLLQAPGWVVAALLLMWLWPKTGWNPWVGAGVLVLWVLKDFALWPWLRVGYEPSAPTGSVRLVGAVGVAAGSIEPRGYVRVAGELWRAELLPGAEPLPAGAEVRIERAEGMTLYVSRINDDERSDPHPPCDRARSSNRSR